MKKVYFQKLSPVFHVTLVIYCQGCQREKRVYCFVFLIHYNISFPFFTSFTWEILPVAGDRQPGERKEYSPLLPHPRQGPLLLLGTPGQGGHHSPQQQFPPPFTSPSAPSFITFHLLSPPFTPCHPHSLPFTPLSHPFIPFHSLSPPFTPFHPLSPPFIPFYSLSPPVNPFHPFYLL